MCFRFDSCFGSGSGQDYGRSTPKATHRGGGRRWGNQADHGYYSGADHKPAPPAYHHMPAADDEARHNTGAGARKDHVDDAGGHTPYAQDKADEALKLPAWHNKVGNDAGHTYTGRLHDPLADRKEHAAADYHHYPTATTTTLARY